MSVPDQFNLSGQINNFAEVIRATIRTASTSLTDGISIIRESLISHLPPDQRGLVYGILENPADDFRKQVYADWLEENGFADAAELLRLIVARQEELNRVSLIADVDKGQRSHGILYERQCAILETFCRGTSRLGSIMWRIGELADREELRPVMLDIDYRHVTRYGRGAFEYALFAKLAPVPMPDISRLAISLFDRRGPDH